MTVEKKAFALSGIACFLIGVVWGMFKWLVPEGGDIFWWSMSFVLCIGIAVVVIVMIEVYLGVQDKDQRNTNGLVLLGLIMLGEGLINLSFAGVGIALFAFFTSWFLNKYIVAIVDWIMSKLK